MGDFPRKKNILIIAEGHEEKPYIDKILSFPNINRDVYSFAETVNAKGNGSIVARYQYEIQRGFFDVILIFCDADKGRKQFLSLVCEIGEKFFQTPESGLEVFMFVNPVTLQVVLSHFGDVCLTKIAKNKNAETVERLTGIKSYHAEQTQIEEMVGKIHYRDLPAFKERLSRISTDINVIPSTNFLVFLERFESEDFSWIDHINSLRKKGND